MLASEYEKLDGLALAKLLETAEVSPFELMELAVRLARERAEPLNALCHQHYEEALEMARQVPLVGAFKGLPFLLKDSGLASKQLPSSLGSRLFSHTRFDYDSTLVERFGVAGLLSFARTTVPELCMAPTTEAAEYAAPTRNPWDTARSPGGSSGGAAVAVAAGVVPLAHGSDGGGSIRIPASCCGVFGLKPSRGLIPMGPSRGEGWGGLATDGVLSRTVRDSAAALDAIAAPEPGAPYAGPAPAGSYLANLERPFSRPLRIAKWTTPWDGAVAEPCLEAVEVAAQALSRNGHQVCAMSAPPNLDYWGFIDGLIDVLATNAALTITAATRGRPSNQWAQLLEPAIFDAYRRGLVTRSVDYVRAITGFHQISRVMEAYMVGFDLVLTPTLTQLPLPLGSLSMDSDFRSFRREAAKYTQFLAIINASGQPASSVPLHWTAEGVPVGIQLIGRYGDEQLLLRTSAQLEATLPWSGRYATLKFPTA
ncbi:amidase [Pseudomonas sp. ZM23]|uniref:Amidase n=1 Tax=Pseudomonas triclosanedens TaxID=2961893 RepID=A0ABY7A4C1_9PSED|nr:amidase [Pseudomonas triclosanedens]MCP8465073.1 amidase [Pseudomonas triclosanedens]MCP8470215.1 amidase [Pseudomonas triclosanedens]MCP8476020.1 amidase [Pseudomonas triclosanedens]WAI51742.1 amidase [Pseudomonas triclosanedens]